MSLETQNGKYKDKEIFIIEKPLILTGVQILPILQIESREIREAREQEEQRIKTFGEFLSGSLSLKEGQQRKIVLHDSNKLDLHRVNGEWEATVDIDPHGKPIRKKVLFSAINFNPFAVYDNGGRQQQIYIFPQEQASSLLKKLDLGKNLTSTERHRHF